jgi:hypothetical protein
MNEEEGNNGCGGGGGGGGGGGLKDYMVQLFTKVVRITIPKDYRNFEITELMWCYSQRSRAMCNM